jgi:hypothetical protein
MKDTNSFLFAFQLNFDDVWDWNGESYKTIIEVISELEKGSSKLIQTLSDGRLETFTSNWYFNLNDFKTKGNNMFILRIYNPITIYYPSAVNTD